MEASVRLPGSKSLTNRALVLAALADGPSVVRRALRSRDTELMAGALTALGAQVDTAGDDWAVHPGALRGPATVDCGLAGTVMRFVPPVAALADGEVALRRRPARAHPPDGRDARAPCATSGSTVDDARSRRPARSPCVGGAGSAGGRVVIDASASSQFVSALLLAGAPFDDGIEVRPRGRTGALPAAHRHDGGVPARARRRGRRRRTRHRWRVAPGRDPRRATSPSSPTCPTPRRSSQRAWSPAAGSPSPAGHRDHPGRRRAPRHPRARWAPTVTARRPTGSR